VEQATTAVNAALAAADSPSSAVDVQPIDAELVRVSIELHGTSGTALDRVRATLGDACLAARLPIRALVPGRTRLESRFAEVTGGQP